MSNVASEIIKVVMTGIKSKDIPKISVIREFGTSSLIF